MCDVLFITPNITGSFRKESLGTLQLATILKNNGITCKVLPFGRIGDISQFNDFLESAIAKVREINTKIVSMYTRCDTFHISLRLAEVIKANWRDMCIVFGGPQSDTTSADVIEHIPYVDYVCCGEGENTIYPFFSSILLGKPDLSIPGLVYRKDGAAVMNPRPELIADLDSLPMIDYIGTYLADYPENFQDKFFSIDVGRGCPFGCSYCSTQAFWGRKYRLKSPARILEEIKAAQREFGVNQFIFSHDMFTFNRKTVMETCRLIRALDTPIRWSCSARLDCLDRELIDVMVDSGLYNIYIGIETGSKRMQKLIHKNLNLDKVMDILLYLKEKKIKVDTSFIYGFPEETEEDLSQTISLISKIAYNQCGLISTHLCTFLPKTELSERYQAQLSHTDCYSNITGDCAIDECQDIIRKHPALFPQLMEYKTQLRSKLKYFPLFIKVWLSITPVYQYISERYTENTLLDMYYEFVRVNQETLDRYGDLPSEEAVDHLIREDKLHLCLENDPNYDLITDCRKMWIVENSDAVKNGEIVTEVYCFDLRERRTVASIQDYKRCVAVTRYCGKKREISLYPI